MVEYLYVIFEYINDYKLAEEKRKDERLIPHPGGFLRCFL